jgi:hypothetical protein
VVKMSLTKGDGSSALGSRGVSRATPWVVKRYTRCWRSAAMPMTVSLGRAGTVVVVNVSQRPAGSSRRRREAPPARVPAHSQRAPDASVVSWRQTTFSLWRPASFPTTLQRPSWKRAMPRAVDAQIVRAPSGRRVSTTCVTISLGSSLSFRKYVQFPRSSRARPPSVPAQSTLAPSSVFVSSRV